jgi:hypothetical protein
MRNRYGLRAMGVLLLLALACRWGLAQIGPRYVIELQGNEQANAHGGQHGHARGNERAHSAGLAQGRLQLVSKGLVLIRFQGLNILAVDADAEAYSQEVVPAWPAADVLLVLPAGAGRYDGLAPLRAMHDGVPVIVAESGSAMQVPATGGPRLYPMQAWNTLDARKHSTRLRVTAMPGQAGTVAVAGYLLEVGNSRASYRLYLSCAALMAEEAAGLAQRLPDADLALLPARDAPRVVPLNRGVPAKGEPAALTAAGYAFTALKR